MERKYYPVCIDLTGKRCLVVGGGKVAERKVLGLIHYGAAVKVISGTLTEQLETLYRGKSIGYEKNTFHKKYLEGVFLVIGATNDPAVNKEVSDSAQKRGILVNIVDTPALCTYITPAVVESGDLSIGISTNGKCPALAANIRKKMEERYGDEYGEFLNLVGELRESVLKKVANPEKRKKIFENMVNSEILTLLRDKRKDEARKRAEVIIGSELEERSA